MRETKLNACFDMGWYKRANERCYDSASGHIRMIGAGTFLLRCYALRVLPQMNLSRKACHTS